MLLVGVEWVKLWRSAVGMRRPWYAGASWFACARSDGPQFNLRVIGKIIVHVWLAGSISARVSLLSRPSTCTIRNTLDFLQFTQEDIPSRKYIAMGSYAVLCTCRLYLDLSGIPTEQRNPPLPPSIWTHQMDRT